MTPTNDRRRCSWPRCNWRGAESEVLRAKSPFDGSDISGCPKCKSINTIHISCDELGCYDFGTIGSPDPAGGPYRVTCWEHSHIAKQRKEHAR
jgi:phage FluMu protein Com